MSGSSALRGAAGLLIVACTSVAVALGVRASGGGDVGRHVIITTPADGTEVARGTDVAINAQVFDPTGVRRWVVFAGGERIASQDLGDSGPTHVPIAVTWRPEEDGTVEIEVRVEGEVGRRPPDRVTVRVVTSTTTTATPTTTGGTSETSRAVTSTTVSPSSTATVATTATTAPSSTAPTTSPTTASTTTSSSTTTTTIPDRSPPVVSASHSPESPSEGQPVTFTVTATDDRRVAAAEIWVQGPGENQPSLVERCPTSSCHAERRYGPGRVTYFGVAFDDAGNQARSAAQTFEVLQIIR
jgi:hypothetical protein